MIPAAHGGGGMHVSATSDSELADESRPGRLSPRVSLAIAAADDDALLMPKQRKSSKFNIGRFALPCATLTGWIIPYRMWSYTSWWMHRASIVLDRIYKEFEKRGWVLLWIPAKPYEPHLWIDCS